MELAASEQSCPLCDTIVVNPKERNPGTPDMPFSSKVELPAEGRIDRRGFAMLFTLILVIPALITMSIDRYANEEIGWSFYVLGALGVIFFWFVFPFFFKKFRAVPMFTVDTAATLGYLYLIEYLTGTSEWFLWLATPITAAAGAITITLYLIFTKKKKPHFLTKIALMLFAIGIYVMIIEAFITNYLDHFEVKNWSLLVMIPCMILGVAVLFVESRESVKEAIRRKLFL